MTLNVSMKSSAKVTKRSSPKPQDQLIYEHIFDAILEQRLAPGTRLKEESLGEVFGVSRTIIRRTLSRLFHEGVAVMLPNKGAFVAKPDVKAAREILDARRLIEISVVERVAHRSSEIQSEIKSLRELIDQEHASSAGDDKGTAIRLSGEFHLALAQLAGNEPIAGFLRSLVPQTSLIISLYESSEGSTCAIDEHSRLLDALLIGDQVKAVDLMHVHLNHIESRLSLEQTTTVDLANIFQHITKRA